MWSSLINLYFTILIATIIAGFVNYKNLDKPVRIILLYLGITLIAEAVAYYSAREFKNNLLVYHIYNPIQLAVLLIFFQSIIHTFKRYKIGFITAIAGFVLSVINSLFFQNPLYKLNTYFLVVESIILISISLFYFYYYLNLDYARSKSERSNFVISCILLIFWSFTFFYWVAGLSIRTSLSDHGVWMKFMIMGISIITYTGFGLVFLFYRKLQSR